MQSARGAKRVCQKEACGARFYDLMHDPIKCPVCQTVFVPPPVDAPNSKSTWRSNRNAPRHTIVAAQPVEDVGDNEAAALESNEPAGNDGTESTTEKPDLLLELDDDDEAGDNGVAAEEKKD